MILKISLRANAGVSKTLVIRKLRVHSLHVFPSEHTYIDWVSRGIQWFPFYFRTSCASLLSLIGRNIGTSRVSDNHVSELPRFLHVFFLPGYNCTPRALLIASLDFMLRVALIPCGVINHGEEKPSFIQSERYPIRRGLAEKQRLAQALFCIWRYSRTIYIIFGM